MPSKPESEAPALPRPRRAIRLWKNPHPPGSTFRRWTLHVIGGLLGAGVLLTPVLGVVAFVTTTLFATLFFAFDQIFLGRLRVRKGGKLPLFLRRWHVLRRPGDLTCPFCHDGLQEAHADCCDSCGTGYHEACRAELLGGCGTLGCEHQGRRRAPAVCKA